MRIDTFHLQPHTAAMRLRHDSEYYLRYRKSVETEMVSGFATFHRNTPESSAAIAFASRDMQSKLSSHKQLADTLILRTFPVGCKRPTPGYGYLEALVQDNVTVFTDGGLQHWTKSGFVDPSGNEHKVDVILLATGFDTSWVPRFPIVADGINLQDLYKDQSVGYLGVAAPHMPNYFTIHGPYGPLASGSAMPIINSFVNYIVQMIRHIQVQDIKSVTPLPRCDRAVCGAHCSIHRSHGLERTVPVLVQGEQSRWQNPFASGVSQPVPGADVEATLSRLTHTSIVRRTCGRGSATAFRQETLTEEIAPGTSALSMARTSRRYMMCMKWSIAEKASWDSCISCSRDVIKTCYRWYRGF